MVRAEAYRPEIDGLRAVAVLAVIANHLDRSVLPSGHLGVDVFFVISGYVITASVLPRVRLLNFREFLLDFYIRRVKRLVPALAVFVLVAGAFIALLDPFPRMSLRTGIAALFGLSNLYLIRQAADYFAASVELNPFVHTWSLGVEEQFYLLFPLAIWTFASGRGRMRTFVALLVMVAAASLACFVLLYDTDKPLAYFLMPTRAWELAAGSLVCLAQRDGERAAAARGLPATPLLVLLLASFFCPLRFAVEATVAAVALTAGLIVALQGRGLAHRALTAAPVQYLGKTSYSLYLWHWGVISVARWTIGLEGWSVLLLLPLMLALSHASYRFVERPLRHATWSRVGARTLGYGAGGLAAVASLLLVVAGPLDGWLYLGRLVGTGDPQHIVRTWWKDLRTGRSLDACHIDAFETATLRRCLTRPSEGRAAVFLIGDSHARNYAPAVAGAFRGMEVLHLTVGRGCALLPAAEAARVPQARCAQYNAEVVDYVAAHVREGDVVAIGQRLFEKDRATNPGPYLANVTAIARRLADRGVVVLLLDGTAPPKLDPRECLDAPWQVATKPGCSIDRAAVEAAFRPFDEAARLATHTAPNLFYAPLRTGLCDERACGQALADGTPIWHDRGHITEKAALALAPRLAAALAEQQFWAEGRPAR
ncbi:acyltransferase family protein [uncultured Alsobacter sp.]|uniref:acyltransferase family protein n=1 Tax=uncultured Alsobacter sp. TaxID=1748258 RepID=UPI0025D31DB2|nr:acyltransferase family protein [uncultured Alsobacter sp.]